MLKLREEWFKSVFYLLIPLFKNKCWIYTMNVDPSTVQFVSNVVKQMFFYRPLKELWTQFSISHLFIIWNVNIFWYHFGFIIIVLFEKLYIICYASDNVRIIITIMHVQQSYIIIKCRHDITEIWLKVALNTIN